MNQLSMTHADICLSNYYETYLREFSKKELYFLLLQLLTHLKKIILALMRVCCCIQSQIFFDSFQDSILSYFVTFCIHNPIFRLRAQLRRDEAEVPRRQKKKFPLLLNK